VQTTNAAGVWVKPELTQTALGNNKQCGMWPIWEDFTGGAGNNQPPWCLSTARNLTDAKTTVETTRISKPTSAVSRADKALTDKAPAAAASPTRNGIINGVDQALLSRCLADCLRTVPGLQRCVQLHLLCSTSQASARTAKKSGTMLTEAEAITAARGLIRGTEPVGTSDDVARTTTLAEAGLPDPAGSGFATDTPVYVVTGDEPARSWNDGSDARYDRWPAVVDAATGDVLYARLDSPK